MTSNTHFVDSVHKHHTREVRDPQRRRTFDSPSTESTKSVWFIRHSRWRAAGTEPLLERMSRTARPAEAPAVLAGTADDPNAPIQKVCPLLQLMCAS